MQQTYKIPFNQSWLSGKEIDYIQQALDSRQLSGDRQFSKQCQAKIKSRIDAKEVLLTTSCTSALEMAALLCDIQPGDEVIMPSFTFVSTANAFLLRGADIKFVDIRPDTLNLDESLIEQAITKKTKAIVPVHYASVACEMDKINGLAESHGLYVIEDAAQALDTKFGNHYCGTIGDAGAFSFHETKNFVSGEGGALVLNRDDWIERAEIIREKGTNRSQFFRGQADKYTWVDCGSSYVPSDILAAVLMAQLESMDTINQMRRKVADAYRAQLGDLAEEGYFSMPYVPEHCTTNNHMFYLVCSSAEMRDQLLSDLNQAGILATFHYVPLHNSPLAKEKGFYKSALPETERVSSHLIRLPMFPDLTSEQIEFICDQVRQSVLKHTGN